MKQTKINLLKDFCDSYLLCQPYSKWYFEFKSHLLLNPARTPCVVECENVRSVLSFRSLCRHMLDRVVLLKQDKGVASPLRWALQWPLMVLYLFGASHSFKNLARNSVRQFYSVLELEKLTPFYKLRLGRVTSQNRSWKISVVHIRPIVCLSGVNANVNLSVFPEFGLSLQL